MSFQQKKRSKLDALQNIAITVLTVTAVLLFLRTQLYTIAPDGGALETLLGGPTTAPDYSTAVTSAELRAPVRVAVSGDKTYGRYGSVTTTTADESFAPLKTFLQEALGSAHSFTVSDEDAFFTALDRPSIYYDFLEPLPLSVLSGLVAGTSGEEHRSARQLVLSAAEDDTVQLVLCDGEGMYYQCQTAITGSDLTGAVNLFELGSGYFAFDYTVLSDHYRRIAPTSLFLEPLPQLPTLSVSTDLPDESSLLEELGFNPHTNSRYTEANGTEVVVEGDLSVRFLPDGTIRYKGSDSEANETRLTVESAGEIPTLQEAASGTCDLLNQLLASYPSDASLYLLKIQRSGSTTTLYFDYQSGGIPIRQASGVPAAEVQLNGRRVSSLNLLLRQYTAGTDTSLLLPMKQTIAIAARQEGKELLIGYTDNGSDTSSAAWLLD